MTELTLVLHNIRSTHNVGAIFRTAEGLGVEKIIISGYTPAPKYHNDTRLPHISNKIHNQIHKTALGAENIVKFEVVDNLKSWIIENIDDKNPLVGLEQASESIPLQKFKPPQKMTLLLGEEVDGISSELMDLCSDFIEIPMFGQKESFNVSVATGMAIFHIKTYDLK